MKASLLTAALVLATSTSAYAEQSCGDLTNQADMNICAGKAYDKSDTELNTLYKQIEARLKNDADTTRLLLTAQRAWVAFRDAECNFSSSVVTGSLYSFIFNSCRDGMTKVRIENLKVYLKCTDGDLDCPVPTV